MCLGLVCVCVCVCGVACFVCEFEFMCVSCVRGCCLWLLCFVVFVVDCVIVVVFCVFRLCC